MNPGSPFWYWYCSFRGPCRTHYPSIASYPLIHSHCRREIKMWVIHHVQWCKHPATEEGLKPDALYESIRPSPIYMITIYIFFGCCPSVDAIEKHSWQTQGKLFIYSLWKAYSLQKWYIYISPSHRFSSLYSSIREDDLTASHEY